MRKLPEAAVRRKPDEQELDRSKNLSPTATMMAPGTLEIYRRTRWSIPLCRTVASLAGFAEVEG